MGPSPRVAHSRWCANPSRPSIEQGGDDHDAEGVRRQVVGESGCGDPALEHGPDGGLVDPPAGEGSALKRTAPQRRFGGIFGDPGRLHVRLDPLIQVLAHRDFPFLAVFLAEPKEPALLVGAQVADP